MKEATNFCDLAVKQYSFLFGHVFLKAFSFAVRGNCILNIELVSFASMESGIATNGQRQTRPVLNCSLLCPFKENEGFLLVTWNAKVHKVRNDFHPDSKLTGNFENVFNYSCHFCDFYWRNSRERPSLNAPLTLEWMFHSWAVTLSSDNSGKVRERLVFKVFEFMHNNFTF